CHGAPEERLGLELGLAAEGYSGREPSHPSSNFLTFELIVPSPPPPREDSPRPQLVPRAAPGPERGPGRPGQTERPAGSLPNAKRSGPSEARLSGPRGAQRLHQGTAPAGRGGPGTPTVGRGTHLAWYRARCSGRCVGLQCTAPGQSVSSDPWIPTEARLALEQEG
ncbi:hypothetical protein MC885_002267, partial [Smutsia gigantea]